MAHLQQLKNTLKIHLPWHGARLMFLAMFLQALFKVRTVNLAEIATTLNPLATTSSNYRRLQRFFADFEINDDLVAKLVLTLIPKPANGYTLTLDRTDWKFGKLTINILVLGVAYQGVSIPVYWMFLNKKGNSNTVERIALLELFISIFGKKCIACLTADREFIGKVWFSYLQKEAILFRIRIHHNTRIATSKQGFMAASAIFEHLAIGQSLVLSHRRTMWGLQVYLVGCKLKAGKYLIIVTTAEPKTALANYAQRWKIEVLFGILKSRGFRFEETHLTDLERISKLLALLTLSVVWALKIGEWRHQQKPLRVKKHGRLAKSIFRYGFDFLRTTLFALDLKVNDWIFLLSFLSCT
jgi:hypothetical protein